ncbi:MAG: carboxypeptidase regulatory-like domain-containing protein [Deltaproteobacteria bacterium]|nr:carboxypeptidase regulatory-like domain-containing protein [Deltaproteobacteria bacterium]
MSIHSRKKALLRRTVQWLAAGAVPFVITACYGPPDGEWPTDIDMDGNTDADADSDSDSDSEADTSSVLDSDSENSTDSVELSDTSVATDSGFVSGTVVDENGNGIGGVLVSCLDVNGVALASGHTSAENGAFEIDAPTGCVTVRFEDTDGIENGGSFAIRDIFLEEMDELDDPVSLSIYQ